MCATTRPGLARRSTSGPRPSLPSCPGRKFSTRASQLSTRRSTIPVAFGCFRLSVMQRLLRAWLDHQSALPSSCLPHCRTGSPFGGSILMMSAPRSPSSRVQKGAATKWPISRTRRPVSGPWLAACSMSLSHLARQLRQIAHRSGGPRTSIVGGCAVHRVTLRSRVKLPRSLPLAGAQEWPAHPESRGAGRLVVIRACLVTGRG